MNITAYRKDKLKTTYTFEFQKLNHSQFENTSSKLEFNANIMIYIMLKVDYFEISQNHIRLFAENGTKRVPKNNWKIRFDLISKI